MTERKKRPRNSDRDDAEQSRLFIKKARERGADEKSNAAADELLGRLAKMPPEPRTNGKKKRDDE